MTKLQNSSDAAFEEAAAQWTSEKQWDPEVSLFTAFKAGAAWGTKDALEASGNSGKYWKELWENERKKLIKIRDEFGIDITKVKV